MERQNKKLILTAGEEIGIKGNLDLIPELFSGDFVGHFLTDGSEISGLAEFREQINQIRRAFPDWTEDIKLILAERDLVGVWYVATGANTGSFLGLPPTDRQMVCNVISIFRIDDNKIAEQWLLPDRYSMNSQLGVIPGTEASEITRDINIRGRRIDVDTDSSDTQGNRKLALLANEEVWTKGNFENLEEMFTRDFVQHFLPFGTLTESLDTFRKPAVAHREAFPDWRERVNLVVAEGDFVLLQFTSTGTNTGSFLGHPPTGKEIQIQEVSIFRMVDGKIAEQWLLPDILSLNQQLGFLST